MTRASRLLAVAAVGFAFAAPGVAQHVDPAANAGLRALTFARHVDSTFGGATGLPHGSAVLQRCDRISDPDQDVACGITFQQTGGIGTFSVTGDGLDVITTQAEINAVLADGTAWVKIVTMIGFCAGPGNNIIGCAPPGSTIAIDNGLSSDTTGEVVAHEFGHNQGLPHRSDVGSPLMAPFIGGDEVNLPECASFHAGLANNGPNTPVNFAPNISCPSSDTVECSAIGGTPANDAQLTGFFAGVSAEDGCEPTPTITNDAPPFFPLGTTSVEFTATDAGTLSDTCSANVTVRDTTAPSILCPTDVTVECTGGNGIDASDPQLAAFFAGVSATDVCDASVTLSNNAPSFFPLGDTTVTFFAVDDSLRQSTCQAVVTVGDTLDPTISFTLDPTLLWPPNHKLVTIAAEVTVDDICDPDPQFVLQSIVSSEPDNGTGDGDTVNDIQSAAFGTPDLSFQLRAERSGSGPGRVYTVEYVVTDGSGNDANATADVVVPHDRSGAAVGFGGFSSSGQAFIDESDFELHASPVTESGSKFSQVVRTRPTTTPTFGIAILSTPWFDAREVDPTTARLGDVVASVGVLESRPEEALVDGLPDFVLTFSTGDSRAILEASHDRTLALRYCTLSGSCYLVPDIFALGPPLK